jgi:hypothetical protein
MSGPLTTRTWWRSSVFWDSFQRLTALRYQRTPFPPCSSLLAPQLGAAGVDFFAQKPTPGASFFLCPPVSLVALVLEKFLSFPESAAILLFPPSRLPPSGQSFLQMALPIGLS